MKGYLLLAALVVLLLIGTATADSHQQEKDIDALDNVDEEEDFQENVGDDEDEFDEDEDNEDDVAEKSSFLSMLRMENDHGKTNYICNGKAKGSCVSQGGHCVYAPFKENCQHLMGAKGRLRKRQCKSKYCRCCIPPPTCDGKIKKPCSKNGGFCVVEPFKANCKAQGGHLHENIRACKSQHCRCCIPGPSTPQPPTLPTTKPPVLESCPAPFKRRGTECFFVHEDKADLLNWDEARVRCLAMGKGVDLAEPHDMVDFVKYIKENYAESEPTIWLGATDRETEGEWDWVSGGHVPAATWTPWPNNQPSGDGNCMEIHYWPHTDFTLTDWHCYKKGHFACEFNEAK